MTTQDYVTYEQNLFDQLCGNTGYQPITTLYGVLSLAEINGVDDIKKSYEQLVEKHLNDYKVFTELCLCLNWKSWEFAEREKQAPQKGKSMCHERGVLYQQLFYKAQELAYENFNEEGILYYSRVTD